MAVIATKSKTSAYTQYKENMARVRAVAAAAVSQLDASVTADQVVGFGYSLKQLDTDLATLAATSNIAQYARDEEDDQSYNAGAEYNAVSSLIDTVLTEVQNVIPVNAGGKLLAWEWGGTGLVPDNYAPVDTADLKTACQAVVDAITV